MKSYSSNEEQWRGIAQMKSNKELVLKWTEMKSNRSHEEPWRALAEINSDEGL
jgi:hypothetical protein